MWPNLKPLESQSSHCSPRVQNKIKKLLITHSINKKIPKNVVVTCKHEEIQNF